MTSKAQMGRPTIFTDDLAAAFCERIANGRSLRDVCSDEDMPSTTTINAWCKDYPDFSAQYDRAKKDRAEFHFEEMFVIADTVPAEAAEVAKARLQIDTRKFSKPSMRWRTTHHLGGFLLLISKPSMRWRTCAFIMPYPLSISKPSMRWRTIRSLLNSNSARRAASAL